MVLIDNEHLDLAKLEHIVLTLKRFLGPQHVYSHKVSAVLEELKIRISHRVRILASKDPNRAVYLQNIDKQILALAAEEKDIWDEIFDGLDYARKEAHAGVMDSQVIAAKETLRLKIDKRREILQRHS